MARLIARLLLLPIVAVPAIIGWWAWDASLATSIYVYVLTVLLGPTLLVGFGSEVGTSSSTDKLPTYRPYRSWSDLPYHDIGGDCSG
jgi:hypothetical protein